MIAIPKDVFWIGPNHSFDLHESYYRYRKSFYLENPTKNMCLFITADSKYVLWINSSLVNRGPARCNNKNQKIDKINITEFLVQGENIICILVYQPGYSHFSYIHRSASGVLFYIQIEDQLISSNQSCKVSKDISYDANVPRQSIYQGGVEKKDLRLEDNWLIHDYDCTTWDDAKIVSEPNDYPWTNTSLNTFPLLNNKIMDVEFMEAKIDHKVKNQNEYLTCQVWDNLKAYKGYSEKERWYQINTNHSTYWLFELDHGRSFQSIIEISNAVGGENIIVYYVEKLKKGIPYISDPKNYCMVRMYDQYTLRTGFQKIVPYNMRGGRYIILEIESFGNLNFKIYANISYYPIKEKEIPSIKNDQIHNIREICKNTFKGCLQDGYIDNPWRENAQWVGDALPQSYIMSSISDDIRPLKRLIELAVEGIYPDGFLPSVVPSEAHSYSVLDYNFTWLELLDFYFFRTRDSELIHDYKNIIKRLVEEFNKYLNDDGLLISKPGKRLFLDWSNVSRNEPNAIYNFHYLYFLQKIQKLFNAVNIEFELKFEIENIKNNILNNFYYDNVWYDDLKHNTFSQLTSAFSILTDINKTGKAKNIISKIVDCSMTDNSDNIMNLSSPFMHFYVFLALEKHKKYYEIIEIIKYKWGFWEKYKYPTTWENWNVDFPDGSQCHAFSAHPIYFINKYSKQLNL